MAIPLSDNIYTESNKPSDARYGPYASVALAKSSVPVPYRHEGLVVGIIEEGKIVDYWWEAGTGDDDLVKKETGSNIDNLTTDDLNEGTNNKYFTEARSIGSKLAGYVKAATVSAITSATSILEAIGILEKALDNKVNTEDGKGLSSNDYTDEDKDKLENIEEEAQKNVQADWNQSNNSADDYIKNKPTLFSGSWNDLTDTPPSFPPAAHTHDISEVSGLSAALSGKVSIEAGKGLFAESDQEKVDAINIDGDGTKFLTNAGTYKSELDPRTYIEESASGSVSIDLANKDIVHIEMSGNITSFNVSNPLVGKTYKIYIIQDSVGNRTLTGLDPKFKTENDIPILLSTDQNAVDLLQLDVFSSTDIKVFPVYNI